MNERWEWFLSAQTEHELDRVFDDVFDIVDQARISGDVRECDNLLQWIVREDVIDRLHCAVFLSCLRLTSTMRNALPSWENAHDKTAHHFLDHAKRGTGFFGNTVSEQTMPPRSAGNHPTGWPAP